MEEHSTGDGIREPGGVLLKTLMWILKKAEGHSQALSRGAGDESFILDHLEGLKRRLDLGTATVRNSLACFSNNSAKCLVVTPAEVMRDHQSFLPLIFLKIQDYSHYVVYNDLELLY